MTYPGSTEPTRVARLRVFSRAAQKWSARLPRRACLWTTLVLGALSVGSGFLVGQTVKSTATSNGAPLSPQRFVLGPRTPVNPPNVGYHGEVMAVADPESNNNLIVCGFRANQQTGAAYEGYVYQSGDGGRTWREVLVDANSQWVSEESCAFGASNQAYFASGVSDTYHGCAYPEYG